MVLISDPDCTCLDFQVTSDALEKIANKVSLVMNMWEREHAVVARVKETMINVCKRDFELMENQISKIEGKYEVKITLKQRDIAASGDSVHVTTIHRSCSLLVRGFPICIDTHWFNMPFLLCVTRLHFSTEGVETLF